MLVLPATHPNQKDLSCRKVFEFYVSWDIFPGDFTETNCMGLHQSKGEALMQRAASRTCVAFEDAALVPCGHKARMAGGSQSSI